MTHSFSHHVFCRGLATLVAVCLSSSAVANNVQVALEGSLLTIVGDNAGNQIQVEQNLLGDILVTGQNGTMVNGLPQVLLPQVLLNAAEIRMEGGNDVVAIGGLAAGNDLYVNLGAGNDGFSTSSSISVGGNMKIEGGQGNDSIHLADLAVAEDLYIDGGIGALNATVTGLNGGKGLTIVADDQGDVISVSDSTAADYITVETKGGNDRVTVSATVAFGLGISTDFGTDVVRISDLLAAADVGVFTGAGNDTVTLSQVFCGKSMTVSVDAGADVVSGVAVAVVEDAVFEGGAGTDTLEDLGISGGVKKEVKEFEIFLP